MAMSAAQARGGCPAKAFTRSSSRTTGQEHIGDHHAQAQGQQHRSQQVQRHQRHNHYGSRGQQQTTPAFYVQVHQCLPCPDYYAASSILPAAPCLEKLSLAQHCGYTWNH